MARQHRANWERADQARKAMDAVGLQDDPEADVSDLLTNLRHYCDKEKLDFDHLVERSYVHHAAEVVPDDLEMSSRAVRKKRSKRVGSRTYGMDGEVTPTGGL